MRTLKKTALVWVLGLLVGAVMAGDGLAQDKKPTARQQLVGSWTLASSVNKRPDGTTYEAFGGNTKGLLMFDRNGRFALQLHGDARRKFASSNRMGGTAEENKSAALGSLAYFGRYTVDPSGKVVMLQVERSSFANWDGSEQKRTFTVSRDKLTWSNPNATAGGAAELTWQRAR